MHVAHRGLNAIVSSNILQGKGIGVLAGFGKEGMTAGMNASIGMSVNLLLQSRHLRLKSPGS
jgi:hypothetical protein